MNKKIHLVVTFLLLAGLGSGLMAQESTIDKPIKLRKSRLSAAVLNANKPSPTSNFISGLTKLFLAGVLAYPYHWMITQHWPAREEAAAVPVEVQAEAPALAQLAQPSVRQVHLSSLHAGVLMVVHCLAAAILFKQAVVEFYHAAVDDDEQYQLPPSSLL